MVLRKLVIRERSEMPFSPPLRRLPFEWFFNDENFEA
jgi:hypothetical protein